MGEPSRAYWGGRAIVVAGGAGFVGGVVVRDLQALGPEVRSAQHRLRDPRPTREAVDGAQVVIHLAANDGGLDFNRNPAPLVYEKT